MSQTSSQDTLDELHDQSAEAGFLESLNLNFPSAEEFFASLTSDRMADPNAEEARRKKAADDAL